MRFLALLLCTSPAFGQFPPPYDSEKGAAPMPAEEAAAKFKMPPGFKVTVFAKEPDVRNPIGCCWDAKGRLWIAENYTYAERPMNFDLSLSDRVVVFHDKDGDGKPDDRFVFMDGLKRLTSVCVGRGGVWLMCPPQLLFVPDKDHDGKPDGPAQVILEGFDVPKENYHNFANGLKWGPDGWLYGRCGASCPGNVRLATEGPDKAVPLAGGIWRFSPELNIFEPLCHGTTNPWGHDWDEDGNCFFVNSVNGHLWHMIPGAHYRRPHTISPNPYVYEPMEMIADHWHFDVGKGWTASRKVDETVDALGGGHAHSGCMIYYGDNWPKEYRGKLMTLNLHGRRINVERLEKYKSGFVGKREPDIFQAADPNFRGIDLTYGPDGAVYVLDWSDTGECHEHIGVQRSSGRIYRIAYGETKKMLLSHQDKLGLSAIAQHMNENNRWYRNLLQAEFAIELQKIHSPPFVMLFNSYHTPRGGISGGINYGNTALDSPVGHIRAIDGMSQERMFRSTISRLEFDCVPSVRLHLASEMQRLNPIARVAAAHVLSAFSQDADDPNIPYLIWYALIPVSNSTPEVLPKLAAEGKIPKVREWIARRLSEMVEAKPGPLDELISLTATAAEGDRRDVLRGMQAGLAGLAKVKAPAAWAKFNKTFTGDDSAKYVAIAQSCDVLFGDGRALDDVRKIALDDKADLNQRKAALASLIAANPLELRTVCEKTIKTRFLNSVAVKGLAKFDDAGKLIASSYGSFHPSERATAIEVLVSRPSFAGELLKEMTAGRIPRGDVSAAQARQIRGFNNAELTASLGKAWGEFRDSPKDKSDFIAKLKGELTKDVLAKANATNGKALFAKHCASCHKLFGEGAEIGPDLTGAGRDDMDYLLSNIVDPSAVVTKDFQITNFQLADGRSVAGIVMSDADGKVTVQTATEKVTLRKAEIESRSPSALSLMPDGLLQTLTVAEVKDLFAYLQAKSRVP
jgi:putative membrane-bound dehydrogenase-like protein